VRLVGAAGGDVGGLHAVDGVSLLNRAGFAGGSNP